jgi:hypothetical protein
MKEADTSHPSLADLEAFDAGHLSATEREAIERHLTVCPECGRVLDALPEDPFVALVRVSAKPHIASPSDTPEPAFSTIPDALSNHPRYRILEALGQGGAGVVCKAVHRVMDRPRRQRWFWLLVAVLLAAGGIAFVIGRHRPTEEPPNAVPPSQGVPRINTSTESQAGPPTPRPVEPLALATPEDVLRLREERCEQAMAWIRKNNRWGADAGVVAGTAEDFARHSGQIDGYLLSFGSRLLRSQQNTLLAANLGGFFDFPLTTAQAKALGLKAGSSRFLSYLNLNDPRRRTPRVRLSDLKIDQANRLDASAKVSGSIAYEVIGPPIARPFALRLSFYNARRRRAVLCWFRQSTLQGRGTLSFHFPVLTSANIQLRGPLVLFVEVCTDLDGVPLVESDSAAILVEAVSPANPPQP